MTIIFLFLFFLFSLIAVFPPKENINKYVLYLVLGLILVLISSFRPEQGNPDYAVYRKLYEDAKTWDAIVEPSYFLISQLVYLVFDNILYLFIIYACLGVYLKLTAIKQLTDLWFLSLMVYVSYFFILHEMVQIRAGIATAFLLLSVKPIYDRNLKLFLVLVLLATFFHVSSLIILPLWFLGIFKDRKKVNTYFLILVLPIAYGIYFLKMTLLNFIPIPYVQEKIDLYTQLQELETDAFLTDINVFNFVFLAKIIIYYFLVYKRELLMTRNKYTVLLLNIYAISLFMYPALAAMPVMAGRVSEFLGVVEIILIPLVYYVFRPHYVGTLLVLVWSLGIIMVNLFKSKLLG